jgi:hypothetical protein
MSALPHPALLLSVVSLLACLAALRLSAWSRLAPARTASAAWKAQRRAARAGDVERRWR